MSPRYLALLRGVNVGGKNRVPMRELAELFTATGCTDIRTFIQSGNVVFSAPEGLYTQLTEILPEGIAQKFALHIPVVLRTAGEVGAVLTGNPFLAAGEAVEMLYVAFLRDLPTPDQVASLKADRSPPDRFVVAGREVYLHLPTGAGNSKLTNAYFDSSLKTVSTARNWRTVNALFEMMRQ